MNIYITYFLSLKTSQSSLGVLIPQYDEGATVLIKRNLTHARHVTRLCEQD